MNLRTFIERPVLSAVISITIVVVGIIGLFSLPVEQYPDIAPPTIMVSTTYYGASAETLQKSVIAPLEEAINGVEDMTYMTSSATNAGTVSITVYFKQGTDPDMAAVNVQNRVSRATGQLPAEVTQVGVTTSKRQTSILQMFSLSSPDDSYDENFLSNYISINLKPEILRISGVGDLMIMGGEYSMRVWMKPDVMAQYKLIPSDITGVLAEQNIESATGSFGENSNETYQYTMKYKGRLITPEEFGDIVIRSTDNGEVLKLKDIAEIQLGQDSYAYHGGMDGHPGISCMVFQTAGSNATAVNKEITAQMERMEKNLPEGTEFVTMMSSNDFLFASIHNVVETLIIAIILVILVVYFFLQDLKSTLIPSISIIVSLVGTFACLVAAGFSLNILTLFALVLAIGTVVDDAIVVVEAVQSKFDAGYKSPYLATKDAMGDVTMAIVSCTCVFMAVFIPVTFMGGTSGVFYTQFGITMATAVGISMISALTLCPALCAIMMRPSDGTKSAKSINGRVRAAYNASFNAVLGKYKKGVMYFIRHRWMVWTSLAATIVLLVYLMSTTKTGLVPQEDQGVIMVNVSISPGSTLEETTKVMDRLEQFANDLDSDMTMFQDGYEETVKEHFNLDSSSSACWYFADSGMHFYFSPYEIAPYSVGDIDIEIPYEELQGVLKEAYFPQAAPVYGDSFSISAAEEGQIDEAQFAQALSVELDENGTKVAIFSGSAIYDIRVEQGRWDDNGQPMAASQVVFAANRLTAQDLILISSNISGEQPNLRLTLQSEAAESRSYFIRQNDENGSISLTEAAS